MKNSKAIAQEILLYMRYEDKTNEPIVEHIDKLFVAYEEALKNEKQVVYHYSNVVRNPQSGYTKIKK